MTNPKEFSKYERARIIGARALQVSMDAPLLIKLDKKELEYVNYDPLKIAEKELDAGVLPISINRPMPKKKQEDIEKLKIDEGSESDEEKTKVEKREEKDISEGGEMMELANSAEEIEESTTEESEEVLE
jgi:DNA-directed RNA polymerase subunit K/omega